MTAPDPHLPDSPAARLARNAGARPAALFFGRSAELDRLGQAADALSRGQARLIAVQGPMGAGKSELLRQAVGLMAAAEQPVLPLYLNVAEADPASCAAVERLLVQATAFRTRSQSDHGTHYLTPDEHLLQTGMGSLLPLLEQARRGISAAALWPLLTSRLHEMGLPPMALLLDGSMEADPDRVQTAARLAEAAHQAGQLVILEAPARLRPLPLRSVEVEQLELGPLELQAAAALLGRLGEQRGWMLGPPCYEPIFRRIGPLPGLLLAWAAQVTPPRSAVATANPVRLAEEAYLRFLSHSAWSADLRRRFEAATPFDRRELALRVIRLTAESSTRSLTPAEAAAMFGDPAQAERSLTLLADLGLITLSSTGIGGAELPALADWAELMMAPPLASEAALISPAHLNLLARHLAAPRPAPEAPGGELLIDQALPELLTAFRGQALPEVLFHFEQYHEALGRLGPRERREAVAVSTHTMQTPEVIGVTRIESSPALRGTAGITLYVARAFSEGKYQRSHEQVWLVANLARTRVATSPELEQALAAFRQAEQSLGPNRYVHWIVLGEGASAEVLELLTRERIYCSCREQLALLQDMLRPAPPRQLPATGSQSGAGAPGFTASPPSPAPAEAAPATPASGARQVIEISSAAPPQREQSAMRLAARQGSEYIAALMAEKVALRGGFDAQAAGRIRTAVLEGVLNAIEHSPNPEKEIDVRFQLHADRIEILIENEGSNFDPLSVAPPDPRAKLTAKNKRGWGISLMKQFMDEVAYDPCDAGTRLRLVKRRAPGQAASESSAPQMMPKAFPEEARYQ